MSTIRPLATIAILAALGVFLAQQIKEPKTGDLVAGAGADAEHFPAPTADAAPPFDPAAVAPPIESPVAVSAPADATPGLPALPELPGAGEAAPAMPPLPAMPALPPVSNSAGALAPPALDVVPLAEGPAAGLPPAVVSQEIPMPDTVAAADYRGVDSAAMPPVPGTPPVPVTPESAAYAQPSADPYSGYAPADAAPLGPADPMQITPAPPVAATPEAPGAAYQSIGELPAQAGASFEQTMPAITQALQSDDLTRAHAMLSSWYRESSLTPQQSAQVDQLLSQLAGTVVYSTEHRLAPAYTVQPSDTLESVARQHNIPWRLLAKINGVRTLDSIQPGQTLKVMRGPFAAVIDATNGEMVLLIDGKYAGKFPVQLTGAAQQEGQWKVTEKPTAQMPALPGMPPSQKQLVLKDDLGAATIVIGAAGGSPMERGRVSVAARDLNELHDILSVGSQVVIKR